MLNLPKINFVGLSRLRCSTLATLVAGVLVLVCLCLPLLWVFDTDTIDERTSSSETVFESESQQWPTIETDYWYNNITIDPENNDHMKHTEYRPSQTIPSQMVSLPRLILDTFIHLQIDRSCKLKAFNSATV